MDKYRVLMIPTKIYPGRNRGKAAGFDDIGKPFSVLTSRQATRF